MSAAAPGFYGKLPGLGDFVSRRLPSAFIDAWDAWLQSVIAGSRAQLGEHWINTYLSSPLWRFALPPGLAGGLAWAGVLMPSVDRVGRFFPLTVASALPATANPLAVLSSAGAWFEAAETLALSALDADAFEMERFASGVEALGAPASVGGAAEGTVTDPAMRVGLQVPLASAAQVDAGYAGLLHQLLRETGEAYSAWSTEGSDLVQPGLLVSRGLPAEQAFTALLDGQWTQWAWGVLPPAAEPAPAAAPGEML